jgi:hypothetical protein
LDETNSGKKEKQETRLPFFECSSKLPLSNTAEFK